MNETHICANCGQAFSRRQKNPKYCSATCYWSTHERSQMVDCVQCGKEFKVFPSQIRKGIRHCSRSCMMTARNLTDQNPSYHRDIRGPNNPMYGQPGMAGELNPMFGRRGSLAPRWKGGRKVRRDGYVLVVAPPDHPHPSDASHSSVKYILEHRLVMEQHLGRYLEPGEVVHHINENPSDNRIENLELIASQAEHAAKHKRRKD